MYYLVANKGVTVTQVSKDMKCQVAETLPGLKQNTMQQSSTTHSSIIICPGMFFTNHDMG